MDQQSEREVSFSSDSQINFQSSFIAREISEMDSENQKFCEYGLEYSRDYYVHGNPEPKKQFPFYLYLRQKYSHLSLQQQINICLRYFVRDGKNLQSQNNQIDTAHIKQLNRGINLFTKLPLNPLLFVQISDYDQQNYLIVVSNSYAQIIHYNIFNKKQKRNVVFEKIKRRLEKKGHPLMFIVDQTSNHLHSMDIKYFQKLSKSMKYHYIKTIKTTEQKQSLCENLFQQPQMKIRILEWVQKITFQMYNSFLWVYSCTYEEKISLQKLREQREEFYSIFQKIKKQQQNYLLKETNCVQFRVRLFNLDALLFNYQKTCDTNKQQFLMELRKIKSRMVPIKMGEINQETDHYPQRLMNCRRCKHCQIMGVKTNKKSKFKCMACSQKYQVDLSLCLNCFGDFHEIVLPNCGYAHPREMKKTYHKFLQREQSQKNLRKIKKKQIKKMTPNVAQSIINLTHNFEDIQKLMIQIEQNQLQCIGVVKMFNQSFLLSILNCFNVLLRKIKQIEKIKHSDP